MNRVNAMRNLATKLTSRLAQAALDFARGRNRGVHGGALVEFAVTGPALVLMMVCAGDLGLGIYRHMQVQNAAQVGAQYAVAHGFDATAISSAVTAVSSYPLSASPAPTQFCGCPSASGVATADCGSTCPSGISAGTYVTVSTQATYTPVVPYPLLPSSFSFSNQSTVRIQ